MTDNAQGTKAQKPKAPARLLASRLRINIKASMCNVVQPHQSDEGPQKECISAPASTLELPPRFCFGTFSPANTAGSSRSRQCAGGLGSGASRASETRQRHQLGPCCTKISPKLSSLKEQEMAWEVDLRV